MSGKGRSKLNRNKLVNARRENRAIGLRTNRLELRALRAHWNRMKFGNESGGKKTKLKNEHPEMRERQERR